MRRRFSHTLLLATCCCLGGCNIRVQDPPPATEDWLVGEWFLGSYGDEYWDEESIQWVRIDEDGGWAYGFRSCTEDYEVSAGAWAEVSPGRIEFAPAEGGLLPFQGFSGDTAILEYADTCPNFVVEYINEDGSAPPVGARKEVSKGTACLELCDQPLEGHTVVVDCNSADPCG